MGEAMRKAGALAALDRLSGELLSKAASDPEPFYLQDVMLLVGQVRTGVSAAAAGKGNSEL